MAKPGIKTKPRTLMDVPLYGAAKPNLAALEAAFDDMAKRPVQKRRQGLRLAIRRLAYFVLSRT